MQSHNRSQPNWLDMSSHDYHAHISRIGRTLSVLPEVPHYPNVHEVFKNKDGHEEEDDHYKHRTVRFAPEVREIVERSRVRNGRAYEENIDDEAGGYIEQKHKAFELCKWKTFKQH